MNKYVHDRREVLRSIAELIEEIEREQGQTDNPARRKELEHFKTALQESKAWAEVVEPFLHEDADHELVYSSTDKVISATQAALEAYLEKEASERPASHKLLRYAQGFLRKTFRGMEDFIDPRRFPPVEIATSCTIALVSDWGTGSRGAINVAKAIRAREPDHVIHLGDVYWIGGRREARTKFVEVWKKYGPPAAQYWAVPGNHEFMSEGRGYFNVILKFCKQPASCFALQNKYWRIIGIDTAYKDHDLHDGGQIEWLKRLLRKGPRSNILLSHHQPLSAVDKRPLHARLHSTMSTHFDLTHIYAWFCGHEHRALIYADPSQFHGCRLRCIGHGGKDEAYKPLAATRLNHLPYTVEPEYRQFRAERSAQGQPILKNGFVLLDMHQDHITVKHIDEDNDVWHEEAWHA